MRLPRDVAAGLLDGEVGDLVALAGVDGLDRVDEVAEHVHAELVGPDGQGGDVLGQAAAAEAEAGVQELAADALVEADRVGEQHDVAAGGLAHLRHGVDEADLGGQERVRRDLDQLGGGDVAAHDRRPVADREGVDLGQHVERVPGVGAEDQPVGVQRVLDRVRLAQELRVPGDLDRVAGRGQLADAAPRAASRCRPGRSTCRRPGTARSAAARGSRSPSRAGGGRPRRPAATACPGRGSGRRPSRRSRCSRW